LQGETPITALALGALVDYPAVEPSEIKVPTLWVVGSEDEDAAANAKAYEGKLAGTQVTLKVVNGATYTDCFVKTTEILDIVKPFLSIPPA
jgi:pimeloyl-ACP methyl ester carboxylesterase